MVISVFKLPEDGKTWAEQKTGDICDCISLEYEKYFNGVGTFTAELPANTRFRDSLEVNSVLVLDSGDALIVKNIRTTLEKITLTGYDLNGLLCDRLTLTDAEDGYDTQKGATETIVKHFVTANLADCQLDPNRNLPRFGVAEDKERGDPEDSAMPRLQNVQELVTEICGAAGLGWRVSINGNAANDKPIFLFDVAEQVDRTADQSERNRVIFSSQTHNVSTVTREVGVTAAKNALFLDIGGTVVQYPQAEDGSDDSGRAVFVGYDRREEYCSLTTESLDKKDYVPEAEQNISDRMNETDSLTVDAGNPLDYGKLYDVGTVVTVYDKARSLQLNSVISAATVRRSGTEYSVKLTLGESKPKLLDQYQKKNTAVGKVVRNDGGKSYSGTALTEYKYISDNSVKFNGVTYTVEKDADTGLISKISDSSGNEFEPEISAGITDVAAHNAVFWAVAMCRGLPRTYKFDDSGIFAYYDSETLDLTMSMWRNKVSAQYNAALTGGSVENNALRLTESDYGVITCAEPMTIYAVFRSNSTGNYHSIISKHMTTYNRGYDFAIVVNPAIILSCRESNVVSGVGSGALHVVCITRSTETAKLYIDGEYIGSSQVYLGDYGGEYTLNKSLRGSGKGDAPGNHFYRMLALGSTEHSEEQVRNNSQYLRQKYISM